MNLLDLKLEHSVDPLFLAKVTDVEKNPWLSFSEVVSKLLGNAKAPDYGKIVENLLTCFNELGCLVSLKVNFSTFTCRFFPQNLGHMSGEHG